MAKELGMLEGNQKGREVRKYFIEFERKLQEARTILTTPLPAAPLQANGPMSILKTFFDAMQAQQAQIADQKALIQDQTTRLNHIENFISASSNHSAMGTRARMKGRKLKYSPALHFEVKNLITSAFRKNTSDKPPGINPNETQEKPNGYFWVSFC